MELIPNIKNPPKTLFVAPTEPVLKLLCAELSIENPRKIFGFCELGFTGDVGVIGPTFGAPAAVVAVEPFLKAGTARIVIIGTVGGVSETLNIGDVFCPSGTIGYDGTSFAYHGKKLTTDFVSKEQLELEDCLNQITKGILATTDTPYLEDERLIETLRDSKVTAIDMEFAALVALTARYPDTALTGAFIVSDVFKDTWQSGFGGKTLKSRLKKLISDVSELK